jgi:hypothetical protein
VDLLTAAVSDNVRWCATVCPGDPTVNPASGLWRTAVAARPLFPDVITVRPRVPAERLVRALEDRPACSTKDSYADVDLAPYGFHELFRATWMGRSASPTGPPPPGWSLVTTEAELVAWWTAADLPTPTPLQLLHADHVHVFARYDERVPVAGAVFTSGDDVVGVSNVFAPTSDDEVVWSEILAVVGHVFPNRPVVGYEHDAELSAVRAVGFEALGPLRVWQRSAV